MSDQTDVLRCELLSYAATVPTGRFDLAATERVVRRRERVLAGLAAGAALAAVVGVSAVHSGGPQRVRTAEGTAADGLPGLVGAGSVTLPAGLTPTQVERSGELVWAVADNAVNQPVVLHGRVGGMLSPLDLSDLDIAGSDVTIALAGDRAYVALSSGSTTNGRARVPDLDELNATTGVDEVDWSLYAQLSGLGRAQRNAYEGDGVALVRTNDGEPVLAITSATGHRQTLRFAVLDPTASPMRDLLSTEVSAPVLVPGDKLTMGEKTPALQGISLVTTAHGLPTYAYLTGTLDTVPVLDLRTGAVSTYRTGAHLSEAGGGTDAAAVGAVGGRVVFATEGADHDVHAQIAAAGALAPLSTGPAGGSVYVSAGRIFRGQDTGHGADLQRLSPKNLQDFGPVSFNPDSGYVATHGDYDVQAVGSWERIAFYAAP